MLANIFSIQVNYYSGIDYLLKKTKIKIPFSGLVSIYIIKQKSVSRKA